MAFTLFTQSFGVANANAKVTISEVGTGAPATILATASGGVVSDRGIVQTDSSGNINVYIDTAKTWKVSLVDETYSPFVAPAMTSTEYSKFQGLVSGAGKIRDATWQRGINIVDYTTDGLQSAAFVENLGLAAAAGVERAAICTTWRQANLTSNTIADWGPSETSVRYAASKCAELGIGVVLKPHVNLASGDYRGNIVPSDPAAWWASYTAYILHYAQIATEIGAQMFVVGTELTSMTNTSTYNTEWRTLIAAVRAVYKGPLTYAANQIGDAHLITWWDALDVIGVNLYDYLTAPEGTTNPGVAELVKLFKTGEKYITDRLDRLYDLWKLPIVCTELGYSQRIDTASHPSTAGSGTISAQAQADAYEAAFRVLMAHPHVSGAYIWLVDATTAIGNGSFTWVRETVTFDVVKRYFTASPMARKAEPSGPMMVQVHGTSTVGVTNGSQVIIGLNSPVGSVWSVQDFDPYAMWDEASYPSRLYSPVRGWYVANLAIRWASSTPSGTRITEILHNSADGATVTPVYRDTRNASASGSTSIFGTSREVWCEPGEYFTARIQQNSGATVNLETSGNERPTFSLRKVG